MSIDGQPAPGRAMFDGDREGACCGRWSGGHEPDLDLLWYLWSGPRSPLFGKDRITTLERDFIADKAPHHETKNPYFKLIHEAVVLRQGARTSSASIPRTA